MCESQFILQTEVEAIVSTCYRGLDGSNYDVRCHMAQLLASILSECLKVKNVSGKRLSMVENLQQFGSAMTLHNDIVRLWFSLCQMLQ